MGSASDYDTLAPACEILAELGIPYEARVVSAHRTPDWLFEYAEGWRRHLHHGFASSDADPLGEALGKDYRVNRAYEAALERGG